MKHFLSLINISIPFGRALNALAHTSIGIGHRLPHDKMPNITVLFADDMTIREFRKEAYKLSLENADQVMYVDFTNTMTMGLSDDCMNITKRSPSNDLIYYAGSICAEMKDLETEPFNLIKGKCKKLKDHLKLYENKENSEFSFKEKVELPNYRSLQAQKLSLTIDRTKEPSEIIHAAVISCLSLSKQADLANLKLLVFEDSDHQVHPYISYHPFPILGSKQQSKFNEITKNVENDEALLKCALKDHEGNTVSLCMLGAEERINAYTKHKSISLWSVELPEDAFY